MNFCWDVFGTSWDGSRRLDWMVGWLDDHPGHRLVTPEMVIELHRGAIFSQRMPETYSGLGTIVNIVMCQVPRSSHLIHKKW